MKFDNDRTVWVGYVPDGGKYLPVSPQPGFIRDNGTVTECFSQARIFSIRNHTRLRAVGVIPIPLTVKLNVEDLMMATLGGRV